MFSFFLGCLAWQIVLVSWPRKQGWSLIPEIGSEQVGVLGFGEAPLVPAE